MENKIKTFEDACQALNISNDVPDVQFLPTRYRKAVISFFMLIIITQALNDGWKPDWSDFTELKWFPWWYINPNGKESLATPVGISADHSRASMGMGAVLCLKNDELASYAGKQFKDLYQDIMFLPQARIPKSTKSKTKTAKS